MAELPRPGHLCPGASIAIVLDEEGTWTDLYQPGLAPPAYRRIFGTGYYRKIRTHRGLTLDHRIIAPFGDDPVLVGEIVVANTTAAPREVTILEFFGVWLHYLAAKLVYITVRRRHYGLRFLDPLLVAFSPLLDVERQRSRFARRFAFEPGDDLFGCGPGSDSKPPQQVGSSTAWRPPTDC